MILWFLRLFARFRELEAIEESQHLLQATVSRLDADIKNLNADLEKWQLRCVQREGQWNESKLDATSLQSSLTDAQAENVRLQDRLEAALEEKAHLWKLFATSIDSERQSLRMQVNKEYGEKFGTVPYPETWSPPASTVRDPNAPREALGRSFDLPSQRAAKQSESNIRAWVDEVAGKS
jgi:hypothetical protein